MQIRRRWFSRNGGWWFWIVCLHETCLSPAPINQSHSFCLPKIVKRKIRKEKKRNRKNWTNWELEMKDESDGDMECRTRSSLFISKFESLCVDQKPIIFPSALYYIALHCFTSIYFINLCHVMPPYATQCTRFTLLTSLYFTSLHLRTDFPKNHLFCPNRLLISTSYALFWSMKYVKIGVSEHLVSEKVGAKMKDTLRLKDR